MSLQSRQMRRLFFASLFLQLRVVWPILSGVLLAMVGPGLLIGYIEGWGIADSLYFTFVTGLTIGYGDLAPRHTVTRLLAVLIGRIRTDHHQLGRLRPYRWTTDAGRWLPIAAGRLSLRLRCQISRTTYCGLTALDFEIALPAACKSVRLVMFEKPETGSFLIIRSSLIALGLVVGISVANAETAKAVADGSFTIAQTNGQDRRDNRQDCRQQNGAVGSDKRDCKQNGRQN